MFLNNFILLEKMNFYNYNNDIKDISKMGNRSSQKIRSEKEFSKEIYDSCPEISINLIAIKHISDVVWKDISSRVMTGELFISVKVECDNDNRINAIRNRINDIIQYINNNQLKNSGLSIISIKDCKFNKYCDYYEYTIQLKPYDSAPK